MHLRRWQVQLRISEPTFPLGWYFWTNQHYYDLDNPPIGDSSNTRLQSGYSILMADVVQKDAVRIFDPALSSTVVSSFETDHEFGPFPTEDGYSPFDTMLVHWLVGGRKVGYTRLRMPVPAAYQEAGLVTQEIWDWVDSSFTFYMLGAKCTSREGVPIESYQVERAVHQWQYRHGTRRRERRVFSW